MKRLKCDDLPPLEAGEDAVAVGVEEHLEAHRAAGRHHGAWRGSVAVSDNKIQFLKSFMTLSHVG